MNSTLSRIDLVLEPSILILGSTAEQALFIHIIHKICTKQYLLTG